MTVSPVRTKPLLEIRDLKKHFPISRLFRRPTEFVHAVDGISFEIAPGELWACRRVRLREVHHRPDAGEAGWSHRRHDRLPRRRVRKDVAHIGRS